MRERDNFVQLTIKTLMNATVSGGILLLSACGGGSDKPAASAQVTKVDIQNALSTSISTGVALPAPPDVTISNASIAGTDVNSNGVRDDIEIAVTKTLMDGSRSVSISDLTKVMDILRYIQPSESGKVIDQKAYYCQYRALPQAVRDRVSMQMLTAHVTDTKMRKVAYHNQSTNTSGSLGAEVCQ